MIRKLLIAGALLVGTMVAESQAQCISGRACGSVPVVQSFNSGFQFQSHSFAPVQSFSVPVQSFAVPVQTVQFDVIPVRQVIDIRSNFHSRQSFGFNQFQSQVIRIRNTHRRGLFR